MLFSLVSFMRHRHQDIECARLWLPFKVIEHAIIAVITLMEKLSHYIYWTMMPSFFRGIVPFVFIKLVWTDLINFIWENKLLQIFICEFLSLEYGPLSWSSILSPISIQVSLEISLEIPLHSVSLKLLLPQAFYLELCKMVGIVLKNYSCTKRNSVKWMQVSC